MSSTPMPRSSTLTPPTALALLIIAAACGGGGGGSASGPNNPPLPPTPAVATVSATGLATGVAPGTTVITATPTGGRSAAATLDVTDSPTAACGGIASAAEFSAALEYAYAVRGQSEGGFDIDAEYRGNATATLVRQPTQIVIETWKGVLRGTASVRERQTSPGSSGTTTLTGGGPMVTLPGGQDATIDLIVDLRSCTYRLVALATLSVARADEGGSSTTSSVPIVAAQVGSRSSLGDWRTLGISDRAAGIPFDGHSLLWLGLNPDRDGFAPLGLASQLMERSATGQEPPVGGATVTFQLTPR